MNTTSIEETILQIIEQDNVSLFEQLFPNEHTMLTEQVPTSSVPRNVNMQLSSGNTMQPLLFVVIVKHANSILDYLMNHFTKVGTAAPLQLNYVNSIHSNALHIAASVNNIEAALMLLSHPAFTKRNERDCYGAHPIHIAATLNHCDLVSMLVTMGNVDVNLRKTQSGKTPLHIAIENNHCEMVSLLLDQLDANFKARDSEHMPAVMKVACNTQQEYKSAFLYNLISRDVDFVCSIKDQQKQNIIHKCAMTGNLRLLQILALMLPFEKYGPLLNEKDGTHQYTPLHFACMDMNLQMVETLLLMGASVMETDAKKNTPCHLLASMPFEKRTQRRTASLICALILNSPQGKELLKAKNSSQESVESLLEQSKFFKPVFGSSPVPSSPVASYKRRSFKKLTPLPVQ